MIQIKDASFVYENGVNGAVITNIDTQIPKGQVVLLCGESGSGKTTFTRLVNGLIPDFYEGELNGSIVVGGKDTSTAELYELAPFVGSVFQDPKSQFYTLATDTEIVFACENLGMEKTEILNRFDKAVTELNVESLLGKSLFALSGGEKQKIACACVDALLPELCVLDEPTSNLDIPSIHDLKKIFLKWKHQGKTIVVAEHHLSWLKGIADRILYFKDGIIAEDMEAECFWQKSEQELQGMGLRPSGAFIPQRIMNSDDLEYIKFKNIKVSYSKKNILDMESFQVPKGKVIAILGNNGSGKTTFARWLCGLVKKSKGSLFYEGKEYRGKQCIDLCYMVMQDVNHQLFSESVLSEVLLGSRGLQKENSELVEKILQELDLSIYKDDHPMSLSGGQRQRVAIATAIVSQKDIIVYDEPTSGLDYRHMKQVARNIDDLSRKGKTQFIITHDSELAQVCCDYFLFFENGKMIQQGTWTKDNVRLIGEYFKQL